MSETPETESQIIEAEPEPETTALAIPETVTQLAPLGAEGKAIIEARKQIIDAAVRASIWLTQPEDWILYKDKNTNRVTGFLQDSGCKRILPIWGIQVTPKGGYQKIEIGVDFAYQISGDAYCKLTDTWINDIEGVRCSTEKYVEQAPELLLKDIRVRQAARANLDGNFIRRHAGLQNMPVQMLEEVWKGTGKSVDRCIRGKGFGTQAERAGATIQPEGKPDIEAPICEACGASLEYHAAGSNKTGSWKAYWKCPKYQWDPKEKKSNGHARWDAAAWEQFLARQQAETSEQNREAATAEG